MILRLLQSTWAPFIATLCARQDVESAGLILAEPLSRTGSGSGTASDVLVARALVVVPSDAYLTRRRNQLRIDPMFLNRALRPARERGWSVFTVHTHPDADRPWFSAADDRGDARLMPSLFVQSSAPHGSLVIAGASGVPVGRVWTDLHRGPMPLDLRIVGQTLELLSPSRMSFGDGDGDGDGDPWFARQRLALGHDGQRVLRELHVGVVGLGGTGSVVASQLAHLGVGQVTLVDADRVEASNVSRIVGATRADVGCAWKVDVAERYAQDVGLGTAVTVVRSALGPGLPPAALAVCDVIFSCVDTHTPRALLNRLAYDVGIPVIDLGSAFRVNSAGAVVDTAGRVVVVGPGRPCLACWGHLDADRLRIEALAPEDIAQLAAEGYVQGAELPAPSVISFNTLVAGAAVVEFLRLVTAFAGADEPPLRLKFDFRTGEVRRNGLVAPDTCGICSRASSRPGLDLARQVS